MLQPATTRHPCRMPTRACLTCPTRGWPERLDLKVPDDIVSTGDPDTLRLLSQRRAPENVPDVELPYSSIDGPIDS